MDQENKIGTNDRDLALRNWACDVLDLDPPDHPIDKSKVRDQAVVSFFDSLNSKDFCAEAVDVAAVEVLCGNPVLPNAFLKHHDQQGLRRLDESLEWFARQLGETSGPDLMAMLNTRLAGLDTHGCSGVVRRYEQKILNAGRVVEDQFPEAKAVVRRLRQSLFHISTVRPTERCQVRSKWVKELRDNFSPEELAKAKHIVERDKNAPKARLHRPILFLLNQEEDDVDDFRLAAPFNTDVQTSSRGQSTGGSSNVEDSLIARVFFLLMMVWFASLVGTYNSRRSGNQTPKMDSPKVNTQQENYDDDVQTLESLKQRQLDQSSKRAKDPFADFNAIDELKKYTPTKPGFLPKQKSTNSLPNVTDPNSQFNEKPGQTGNSLPGAQP